MLLFIVLPIALFVNVGASRPQSINLELHTVLEFDKTSDIYFLKNIRNILDKINDILSSDTEKKAFKRHKNQPTFTDFLKKSLQIVKSLRDNELRYIFRTIRDEIESFDTEDSFEEDLRRFVNRKLDDFTGDPKKMRSNIDEFLKKTYTDKRNRKRHYFLSFMNNVYDKNYHSSFLNYLNKMDLFRRSSKRSNDELKRIVTTITRDILDKYTSLRKNKKQMLQSWLKDNTLLNNVVVTKSNKKTKTNKYKLLKEKVSSSVEEDKEDVHTLKLKQKKNTKSSKKLTHITLYPSSIEMSQMRSKLRSGFSFKKSKTSTKSTESHDISLSNEEINNDNLNDIFANLNSESAKRDSMELFGNSPTLVNKLETFRHKKNYKTTSEISDTISNKRTTKMENPPLESFEHFGSLYSMKKIKTSPKILTHVMESTTNDVLNRIENKTSTTTINKVDKLFNGGITNSMYLHRRAYLPSTTNKTTVKLTYENITNGYDNITYTHLTTARKEKQTTNKIYDKEDFNKSANFKTISEVSSQKALEISASNISTAEHATTVFDVNKFIKNSQIQNLEDTEKKKEIEKKMKEDLTFLLSTTNAATEAYTDVFKDLEDAFNLS